jgi:hypothetical protein
MSYQLQGLTQLVTADVTTGTVTFAACTTNAFLISNVTSTTGAWVNVQNTSATSSTFHHAVIGTPASALYIPASSSLVVAGNFGSSGAPQTVYIKTITAATSATLVISPVTLQRTGNL